jgi:hypothetical protein
MKGPVWTLEDAKSLAWICLDVLGCVRGHLTRRCGTFYGVMGHYGVVDIFYYKGHGNGIVLYTTAVDPEYRKLGDTFLWCKGTQCNNGTDEKDGTMVAVYGIV